VFHVSKLRRTVAILVAASSVAAATGPITPAASAADNNDGPGYDNTSLCESLHNSYNDLMLIAQVNMDEGHRSDAIRALRDAKSVRDQAYNEKCGWAARVIVPQKPGVNKPAQSVRAKATR
jgi:hypothetical protein